MREQALDDLHPVLPVIQYQHRVDRNEHKQYGRKRRRGKGVLDEHQNSRGRLIGNFIDPFLLTFPGDSKNIDQHAA